MWIVTQMVYCPSFYELTNDLLEGTDHCSPKTTVVTNLVDIGLCRRKLEPDVPFYLFLPSPSTGHRLLYVTLPDLKIDFLVVVLVSCLYFYTVLPTDYSTSERHCPLSSLFLGTDLSNSVLSSSIS